MAARTAVEADPDIAAAANISAFNTGIAGGSAAGGLVLHSAGFTGVALTGAALVAALLLPVVRTGR